MIPKITHDKKGHVIYIELSENQAKKVNRIVFNGVLVIVHLDKLDKIVGLEILYNREPAKIAEIKNVLNLAGRLAREIGNA